MSPQPFEAILALPRRSPRWLPRIGPRQNGREKCLPANSSYRPRAVLFWRDAAEPPSTAASTAASTRRYANAAYDIVEVACAGNERSTSQRYARTQKATLQTRGSNTARPWQCKIYRYDGTDLWVLFAEAKPRRVARKQLELRCAARAGAAMARDVPARRASSVDDRPRPS